MRGLIRRAVVAAGAAVVLLGSATGAAASAGAAVPGWSVTPTPNPQIPTGQLFWASCTGSHSCIAVGVHVKTSGRGASLAEQWDGTSWRIVPTPNPPGSTFAALLGVACSTPVACTAVGTSTIGGATQALVERWNGVAWRIQQTPNPAQGGGFLNAVACPSASSCTAVGVSNAGTLAERWDGTRWTIQPTPNGPQGGGGLSGVACPSASSCTAVGSSSAGTLAERWDGTRWTIQPAPNPVQGGSFLTSVACRSVASCTAVGGSNAGTLAERWDGTNWIIQPTPSPAGSPPAFLNTVACPSSAECTATGAYTNSSGTAQTLAERWNGTQWAVQATPNAAAGAASLLIGVACTSAAACTAVGFSELNGATAVLVERSAGSTWRVQAAPSPPGAASSYLNSVWCASPSACITVGATATKTRTSATLAERWNGHTWAIGPIPSPPGGGALNSVSCTSLSACTAVGGRADGTTLAERWNGTSWRIQPTADPPGGAFLNSVSCTSGAACTAVGNTNGGKTLAERWDGTSWRIQPTPNPASSNPFISLSAVACTSPSACMAVGGQADSSGNGAGTLAERWNGQNWQIVPTFKPTGPGSFLGGVACTSPAACTAVGSSGPVTTLAERWNGTRWQVQATPNPPGGQNIFLTTVACPTATACTAFGLNLASNRPPLTLAERWNGHGWAIQPTPDITQSFDIGTPGVACPTVSSCFAVASYNNNGDPSLTLAEQWTTTPGSPAATGRPAAPSGAALACATSPALKLASAVRASPTLPLRESIARTLTNRASKAWSAHACRLAP